MAGLLSLIRKGAKEITDKLERLRIDVIEEATEFSSSLECQFFPEEFSDSKEVEYATIDILGMSHPVYMWVYSGERTISFPIVLVQEVKNYEFKPAPENAQKGIKKYVRTEDIRFVIKWLRRLTYPFYNVVGKAYPPPLLRLYTPNLKIGYGANLNMLYVYMTRCDVRYEDLYPDNTPRVAVVDVEFIETRASGEKFLRDRFTDFEDLKLLGR
jgi:hypothetical protein